ncbi:hypothetical protein LAZ67_19002198 [Cordylochernes scorpioides]|uniref:Retrovirus-related Pol polyprotein from transposon TNT 1-94 n=1 Tax=Cordylochernes scorpioides TaxID=51811 RepID=A0ABY6LN46_9ARAC|nr:hypothetical protein LAZ67_19002198 [Cordylochernes scorpioides]
MFLDETKAKKVWDELKKIYTGNLEDKIIDIGLELKNIKMKNNESINEYMARAKNIASQSSSLGHQISQRELAFHVVRGIHPRLEKIAVVLRTRRDLTLDEIRQSLREEENRMNSKMNGSHSDENEQAYRSKDRRNHYQQNRQKECFVCHKKGHLAKDCWFKNKRTQEQHGKRNANSNTNYNKQNFRNNANTVSSKPAEQTFNTSTDRVFENSSNNYSQIQTWCLDSGCTTHLSPHLDWMKNVMPYESEINLAEEGKVTHATAKGDIKVSTCTENGIENVQIKGVLHVPNLRSNLLSIYELTNKGNTVIFNRYGAKIYNEQDDLIAEAQIQDRMYVMETRSRDEYSEKTENVMTTKDDFSNDNISLWHRRLNHLNEAYMKEIIQRNVVLGVNVKFKNLPECEACIMGKLTRQPYHPVTTNCTTKPLELVHMDLYGPMPYQSLGGSKYFFVLVDDFSRRTFIYFLKNKDETLGKFEEFKARVENELNLKIKDLRTDNGTEFTNHRFKNLLIKNGIHHQLSTTYSPQSNGVAERVNRNLIETARTLLFDSGLPLAFWAEAVATASYVKNCTPHKSIKLDTPMEKWKGRKPSIRHFRIFGCLAFWPITQQHRSKFMPKSRKGIFVGYSLKRKAYRVYDIITKKIEEVRSVKFVENEKGIDYAKNLQEDTNYDHFAYKKEEKNDNEIDLRTRPETSELNEETIPTLDEPNEERIVRSGRKKGDTQKVLEEKHRAKLREEEMKLLEQGVRRSQKIKERNNVNFILEPEESIPENYEEAINCENKYEWLEAMKEELYSIDKHKVWTLVQREKNMKIINCKWIFSIKSTPSEGVYRRKARLVAIGCNQKYGMEYEESFSPVIRKESLRAIVALAAQLNLVITSYDVKTAYLYGELKETIFMKQPEGFVEKDFWAVQTFYGVNSVSWCAARFIEFHDLVSEKGSREPVKVDRMTEDSNMQRMTEAGDEYFADALTNMQPHCEDLVSRLTDAIRGIAVPRVEEALISPFDGSYAASNFIQQLERTSEGPQDDATLQTRLRTLLKDQREIQEQVGKMLEYDIIEPSFSPYSSPVTLVTKRDKTKRFCVDYRRLNEIIFPDVHPLPLIENILDKLANAKIYSRADFSSAYWSIEISPPDRNLLSFVTLEDLNNHLNPYPNIIESRKLAIQRTNDRHGKEKLKYDNKHKNPHFDTGDLVLVKAYHHPNSGTQLIT